MATVGGGSGGVLYCPADALRRQWMSPHLLVATRLRNIKDHATNDVLAVAHCGIAGSGIEGNNPVENTFMKTLSYYFDTEGYEEDGGHDHSRRFCDERSCLSNAKGMLGT